MGKLTRHTFRDFIAVLVMLAFASAPLQAAHADTIIAGKAQPQVQNSAINTVAVDTNGFLSVTGGATSGSTSGSASGLMVGGTDSTNYRNLRTDIAGRLETVGSMANGASGGNSAGNMVGGTDGTNYRSFAVNNSGQLTINGTQNPGSTAPNVALGVGGVYNSTLPTLTTGQFGALQLGARGGLHSVVCADGSVNCASVNPPQDTLGGSTPALYVFSAGGLYNNSGEDMARSINGIASSAGTGVAAVHQAPTNSGAAGVSAVASATATAGGNYTTSGTNLYRVAVTAGASAGYLMAFDIATTVADGVVTPRMCRPVAANASIDVDFSIVPSRYSSGLSIYFSTTGCFTKTASSTAFIEAFYK